MKRAKFKLLIRPTRLADEEGPPLDLRHDYKRNGATLFAALELAQEKGGGQCDRRHRHQEFLKFLRRLDQEFTAPVPRIWSWIFGTHKNREVRTWPKSVPRFVLHFAPTSSSWLKLLKRCFSELSRQC